jgi:hypothetical protein
LAGKRAKSGHYFFYGYRPIGVFFKSITFRGMKARDLTDRFQDWQKRAGETARTMGQATDDYVRENTWVTIACAALVGCVLGFLLANRGED